MTNRQRLAECAAHGHDWNIISLDFKPVRLICSNCGHKYDVVRGNEVRADQTQQIMNWLLSYADRNDKPQARWAAQVIAREFKASDNGSTRQTSKQ